MTLRMLPQRVYRRDGARSYVQNDRLYAERGRERPAKWSMEAQEQDQEHMEEALLVRLLKIVDGEFDLRVVPGENGHLIQIGRWTCNVRFCPGRIRVSAGGSEWEDVPLPKSGRKWDQIRRDLVSKVRWYSDVRAAQRWKKVWSQAVPPLWTDRLAVSPGGETADLTIRLRDVSLHTAGRLVTLLQSVGIAAYTTRQKVTMDRHFAGSDRSGRATDA